MRPLYFLSAFLPLVLISGYAFTKCSAPQAVVNTPPLAIEFNADFIDSTVAKPLDLNDRDAVLSALFRAKPEGFTVYPSEGYYYFTFVNAGEMVKGNFRFDMQERNERKFSFIYYKELANSDHSATNEQYWVLGAGEDGIDLIKKSEFTYEITYKDFRIPVNIYDAKEELKADIELGETEEYVGPIFDESGVRFHLVFDTKADTFVYVLNDMFGHPESYSSLDKDDDILVGTRSRFAYFNDKTNQRYVLIGVSRRNIADNNYYDGPFDQLPDSFVDPMHLKELIERHEPRTIGKIREYGDFIDEEDTRYAIAPYIEYAATGVLLEYKECLTVKDDRSKLNACLASKEL